MKPFVLLCSSIVMFMVHTSVARPPTKNANTPDQPETINGTKDLDLGIEYNRYLQEVVQVLESDPEFRKKLESTDAEKIRDGSIAEELQFVNHRVRNQLDDIKRRELDRLRHLAMRQFELNEGIDRDSIKIPNHLEFQNPSFGPDDLRKLIQSTTKDLEEADRKRREEFKKYEMEKKFEKEERLKHIEDEEKRKEEEKRLKELEEKHKKHEKPHHPMTKDQLEEVWEEQDHMRAEDWNPKTFFAMHDLNGDGLWDEDELRVLFNKELDKVYDKNAPEDDMREREEEMERMREHVFKESDQNKDRLISYDEFLAETKRDEFENDPGWNTLDYEDDVFTDEEFRAFEMQRQREIQDLLNKGIVPDGYPYYGQLPPGAVPYHPPVPGQYQHHPQQPQMGIPGQPAYHPQQQFGQPQFAQPQQQFGQAQQQFAQPQQQFGQPQVPGNPQQPRQQPPQPGQVPVQQGQPQPGQQQFQQAQRSADQQGQPQFQQQPGQPQFKQEQRPLQQDGQPDQYQGGQPQFQQGQPQFQQPGQQQFQPQQPGQQQFQQQQTGQFQQKHGQPQFQQQQPGQPQYQQQAGQPQYQQQAGQPQYQQQAGQSQFQERQQQQPGIKDSNAQQQQQQRP